MVGHQVLLQLVKPSGRLWQAYTVFLKYVTESLASSQVEGEFAGMVKLHALAPDLVPKPIARGKLKESESAIASPEGAGGRATTYFLITEFKNFTSSNVLPDAAKLGARLAALHRRSALTMLGGTSTSTSGGRFGFGIQTYDGSRTQAVGWQDRWTPFFAQLLAEAYRQDTEANGTWPELEAAYQRVQSHLIPRLIGALEADGRSVTPVLIHGDLWDRNVGVEQNTSDPWIFDCGVYYAHHEMELGIWRAENIG
ncbi:hypothetical protein SLS62_004697 [Diatrype stigma]|uniref:protein-ribulosamine 3-kinase n=1 Tax=Diatrype stigma TaxID=117547 RepID=A0AAN9UU14_9PEZI